MKKEIGVTAVLIVLFTPEAVELVPAQNHDVSRVLRGSDTGTGGVVKTSEKKHYRGARCFHTDTLQDSVPRHVS